MLLFRERLKGLSFSRRQFFSKSMVVQPQKTHVTIGLTGGIAAGKSTVLAALKRLGGVVIDADKVGHSTYLPGTECYNDLIEEFGEGIVGSDGFINRKELGRIVFNSPEKRELLNSIVWPALKEDLKKEISDIQENIPIESTSSSPVIIVLEAAILIEAGWVDLTDEVWVVSADEDRCSERLMERNNFTKDQALARIRSQICNKERESYAQVILHNNKSEKDLQTLTKVEIRKFKKRWLSHSNL